MGGMSILWNLVRTLQEVWLVECADKAHREWYGPTYNNDAVVCQAGLIDWVQEPVMEVFSNV